jgi:hypothetical protein
MSYELEYAPDEYDERDGCKQQNDRIDDLLYDSREKRVKCGHSP